MDEATVGQALVPAEPPAADQLLDHEAGQKSVHRVGRTRADDETAARPEHTSKLPRAPPHAVELEMADAVACEQSAVEARSVERQRLQRPLRQTARRPRHGPPRRGPLDHAGAQIDARDVIALLRQRDRGAAAPGADAPGPTPPAERTAGPEQPRRPSARAARTGARPQDARRKPLPTPARRSKRLDLSFRT